MAHLLPFPQTRRLLSEYQLPLIHTVYTHDPNELRWQFAQMEKPAVLKATGPGIMHKTERGLVYTGLTVREQLDDCIRNIKSHVNGDFTYLLQQQAKGAELIIGGKRDASFGPVILFGTGGIYAELLDDVTVRPAPLSAKDAGQMLDETHARRFVKGFRGQSMNARVMKTLLQRAGKLLVREKSVQEFDFNPVIANETSAVIVDARIVVE